MSKLMHAIAVDYTGDLDNHELVRITQKRHPAEWAEYERDRALKGGLTMAGDVLDSLGRSPAPRLPGFEQYAVPARLTVPNGEGGVTHRRFEDCRIVGRDSDLLAHERHVLDPHLAAVQRARDEFVALRKRLERSARKLKVSTGEEWLQAIEDGEAP